MYFADLSSCESKDMICLSVLDDVVNTWNGRLWCVNGKLLNKLVKKDLD